MRDRVPLALPARSEDGATSKIDVAYHFDHVRTSIHHVAYHFDHVAYHFDHVAYHFDHVRTSVDHVATLKINVAYHFDHVRTSVDHVATLKINASRSSRLDPVFLELLVEGRDGDPQRARGVGLVPLGAAESLGNRGALDMFEGLPREGE